MTFNASVVGLSQVYSGDLIHMHGKDKFTAMFNGLHIKMARWKIYGDF